MRPSALKILRVLAVSGLLLCGWLLWMKLSGQIDSIAGCGAGSSCSDVLGSRWSQVLMVPVSALAALVYASLLVLSFRVQRDLMLMIAVVLLGAALWFAGIQWFALESFCPWCLASHAIGLLSGLTILAGLHPRPTRPGLPLFTAALLLITLMVAQVFGPKPKTHRLEEMVAKTSMGLSEGLPRLGPEDAQHVMVEFFDYTCAACRDMSGDLGMLLELYPSEVAVTLVPTIAPHDHQPGDTHDHDQAKEVARLALAVWRVKPEAFQEVHQSFFANFPISSQRARDIAVERLGESVLDDALADPWLEERFARNLEWFGPLTEENPKMPKLLIKEGLLMHGVARNKAEFLKVVSEKLGL